MLVILMILGCITALCAAIVQWIKEKKSGEKHHNYTLMFVFIGTVLATVTSIMQSIESEQSEKKLLDSYNALKDKSDRNNLQIIKTLAEYGLEYNHSLKRIVKLVKDSTNKPSTKIIESELPTLLWETLNGEIGWRLMADSVSFLYTFSSKDATSRNIDLNASIAVTDTFNSISHLNNFNDFVFDGVQHMLNRVTIAKNQEMSSSLLWIKLKYKYRIIWTRGSYENNDTSRRFPFDEIIVYSFKTHSSFFIHGDLKSSISNWFNKKEKRR